MAKAAMLRTALAALVLAAATGTGRGNDTPPPFPTTSLVPWTKDSLKGAFKNGGKASVAGNSLLLTSTSTTGGSLAVTGSWWTGGQALFSAPFGMDMGDTSTIAGLQVIFNATGPNSGAVEIDIFARSNGTGLDVTAGQFGGAPPAMQGFPGIDCIFFQAEREADGDVALSASPDGQSFSPLFTFPAASVPAPAEGTTPALVSVATHGGSKGTMIEVGAPTKTFGFGSGVMKDAVDAIGFARSLESQARSDLRRGNGSSAHPKLVQSSVYLDQAISTIKGSAYGSTVPGKAAVKALGAAKKLDGEADAASTSDPDGARGRLNEADKLKADALAQLRKL